MEGDDECEHLPKHSSSPFIRWTQSVVDRRAISDYLNQVGRPRVSILRCDRSWREHSPGNFHEGVR